MTSGSSGLCVRPGGPGRPGPGFGPTIIKKSLPRAELGLRSGRGAERLTGRPSHKPAQCLIWSASNATRLVTTPGIVLTRRAVEKEAAVTEKEAVDEEEARATTVEIAVTSQENASRIDAELVALTLNVISAAVVDTSLGNAQMVVVVDAKEVMDIVLVVAADRNVITAVKLVIFLVNVGKICVHKITVLEICGLEILSYHCFRTKKDKLARHVLKKVQSEQCRFTAGLKR
ncbi:unnamed protein product [Caenorhabditis auriculariae]|uniref:Uncharacterized protein n=1 Tax=Caenorhabditis auriculariae TaxID=2777116 RepID=A0A8S1HZB3_9PELO|nr:unnamed protein product [Caenorhabditis auriculariae]